jgi:hypothetical protein
VKQHGRNSVCRAVAATSRRRSPGRDGQLGSLVFLSVSRHPAGALLTLWPPTAQCVDDLPRGARFRNE